MSLYFTKIKLSNFKPYYSLGSSEKSEIKLYDKNKDGNLSINLGPTGHGKTSINHAILWCIYGENYRKNWDAWANQLASKLKFQMPGDSRYDVSVELHVLIEEEEYVITRSGGVKVNDIINQEKNKIIDLEIETTNLRIRKGIDALKETEINEFVVKHFVPVELMEYFVFDADDLMAAFKENRKKLIANQIDKLMGVGNLDKISEILTYVDQEVNKEKAKVEKKGSDAKLLLQKRNLPKP